MSVRLILGRQLGTYAIYVFAWYDKSEVPNVEWAAGNYSG